MRPASDSRRFRAAPVGRYLVGRAFLVWCASPTLTGTVVWGRVTEPDVDALIDAWAHEDALAPHFDAVVDLTRLDAVEPAAFARLSAYVRALAPRYAGRLRRQVIAHGAGFAAAVVAGFHPTQSTHAPFAWAVHPSIADAFDDLARHGRADARAARDAVDALVAREAAADPERRALDAYLRDHLLAPTVELAAAALSTSPRTLQRRLRDAGTSFRDEVQRVRLDAARVRLATTDDKIEAIARAVGFSTGSHLARAFRAVDGDTPAAYRARTRAGAPR